MAKVPSSSTRNLHRSIRQPPIISVQQRLLIESLYADKPLTTHGSIGTTRGGDTGLYLKVLVDAGLMTEHIGEMRGRRQVIRYQLTEKGTQLAELLTEISDANDIIREARPPCTKKRKS